MSLVRAMQSAELFEPERFAFSLNVPPVPCGRPRVVRQPGRKVRAFTPERTHAFKEAVRTTAIAARPLSWSLIGWFRVELVVRRAARRGDADNFYKGVADALKRIAWCDDAQVLAIEAVMRDGMTPGVDVQILRFKGPDV